MRLVAVRFADLGPLQARVYAWLAAACARPGCDLAVDLLVRACSDRRAQLLLVLDGGRTVAAGVTQVRDAPDETRSCWVLAVAGNGGPRAWRAALREIERGATRVGCGCVEFVGRPGWRRLHPDYAAETCEAGTHFSKRLDQP